MLAVWISLMCFSGFVVLFVFVAKEFLDLRDLNPEVWESGFELPRSTFPYCGELGPLLEAVQRAQGIRFRQLGSDRINFYVPRRWHHVFRGLSRARAQMVLHSGHVEVRARLAWASLAFTSVVPGVFVLLLGYGLATGVDDPQGAALGMVVLCAGSVGALLFTRRIEFVLVKNAVWRVRRCLTVSHGDHDS